MSVELRTNYSTPLTVPGTENGQPRILNWTNKAVERKLLVYSISQETENMQTHIHWHSISPSCANAEHLIFGKTKTCKKLNWKFSTIHDNH